MSGELASWFELVPEGERSGLGSSASTSTGSPAAAVRGPYSGDTPRGGFVPEIVTETGGPVIVSTTIISGPPARPGSPRAPTSSRTVPVMVCWNELPLPSKLVIVDEVTVSTHCPGL